MNYIQLSFQFSTIEEYQRDLLIAELAAIGFDTFEDTDNAGKDFKTYMQLSRWNENALNEVLAAFPGLPPYTYRIEELEGKNWNEEWEKNFSPLTIADQCYIRATFHDAHPEFPYEIVIDPKMAFGTGHHQTTSMMLEYLLAGDVAGKNMLDMGAGTGILAILAAKKGAADLVAIDYDELCYNSMLENITLNNVPRIKVILGGKEAIPDEIFDVIYANINRNILLDQIDRYAGVLTGNGDLYMSGFYESPDLDIIREHAARFGLTYIDHKKNGDWVAARFRKI